MAGVTATGFLKKTLAECVAEREATYKLTFGNNINLKPPSFFSMIIGIEAAREADAWNAMEETFLSRGSSTAQGVSLDNAIELVDIERLPALPSKTFEQLFFGTVGSFIGTDLILSVDTDPTAKFSPLSGGTLAAGINEVQHLAFSVVPDAGTWTLTMPDGQTTGSLAYNANATAVQNAIQALTADDDWSGVTVAGDYTSGFTLTFAGTSGLQPWALVTPHSSVTRTAGAVTITPSETTLGVAQLVLTMVCKTDGPVLATAGSLTVIDTPVAGLQSTKNNDDAELGRLVESDSDYRIRKDAELQKDSSATIEAIRIALKDVADVKEAIVYENTSLTTDGNSVPGKAIHAYVDGGTSADIAEALWTAVGGGIETYGTVLVTITDSQGLTHVMKFDRPTDKPVYTIITINKNSSYPANGDTLVLDALLAYGAGLKIGTGVLVKPKLIPAIVDTVPGIDDITVQLGFAPAPVATANLAIGPAERATFVEANTTVISS